MLTITFDGASVGQIHLRPPLSLLLRAAPIWMRKREEDEEEEGRMKKERMWHLPVWISGCVSCGLKGVVGKGVIMTMIVYLR